MEMSRRAFLTTAGVVAGTLLDPFGLDLSTTRAYAQRVSIKRGRITTTICPYCGVGCGILVTAAEGNIVDVTGDPDHPINQGALCSKGAALSQVVNERRLSKVLYRAAGASDWEEKDWDWTIARIAEKIKETRDATFELTDQQDRVVNRTSAIGCLGSAALDNEECYLVSKFARALGIVYLDHCARLCHSSTVAALAASFGRGAMTNHFNDIANSDCILIIGSNAAEMHPISFKWVTKAMEKGAKLISADPRFTRTSSRADIYAPFRPGTDVALISGMVNYALQNDLVQREYVVAHTNASFLLDPEFEFDAGLFGEYTGTLLQNGKYTKEHWRYQTDAGGTIKKDPTLKDPHCVYQRLKKHFSRYTPEVVSAVAGTPQDVFLQAAEAFCATHEADKSGTIMYSMGTTQHTTGTQNIRTYAILQMLLGNIGVAGGGINALRGESNVQGSTDHCVLYHILPGYLKSPIAENDSLESYLGKWTPVSQDSKSGNWWQNYPKYTVSLLKAFWGDHATEENDFAYDYLPKRTGDCSHLALFHEMDEGNIKALINIGHNPAVSGANLNVVRRALGKLDWLVVFDLFETETAAFWKRPGANPSDIQTEVFLLPAAVSFEKEGSVTNSGRWGQWRYEAVPPPGDAKSDLWILTRLVAALKNVYADGGTFPAPIEHLDWSYGDEEPDVHLVAKEINGYFLRDVEFKGTLYKTGDLVPSFAALQADGSTNSGNWLYCGSYTNKGNMMARRERSTPEDDPIDLNPNWSWCWPVNRRILYNRASCDAKGRPWAPDKPVIAYDWRAGKWLGDVPDGGWPPLRNPDGTPNPAGKYSFIMRKEGHGSLFSPDPKDGPFPEHYEPLESPVLNRLCDQQNNPMIRVWRPEETGNAEKFPIVATSFRLTEHYQTGSLTRNQPWLVELMPGPFIEVGVELAARKGIENGDLITMSSARGEVTMHAVVTARIGSLQLGDKTVDVVGLVWHFGYQGLATGDSANLLTPHVGDANTTIPEYKAFLCDIRKGGTI